MRRFQNMRCSFPCRRSTLDVSMTGAALQTCRVACFLQHIGRAVQSGDKVQIAGLAWHFVRCDEIRRKPRIDFVVAHFQLLMKTRRKM